MTMKGNKTITTRSWTSCFCLHGTDNNIFRKIDACYKIWSLTYVANTKFGAWGPKFNNLLFNCKFHQIVSEIRL